MTGWSMSLLPKVCQAIDERVLSIFTEQSYLALVGVEPRLLYADAGESVGLRHTRTSADMLIAFSWKELKT